MSKAELNLGTNLRRRAAEVVFASSVALGAITVSLYNNQDRSPDLFSVKPNISDEVRNSEQYQNMERALRLIIKLQEKRPAPPAVLVVSFINTTANLLLLNSIRRRSKATSFPER